MSYFDWTSFSLFFSASSTQNYLKKCYTDQHIENAEQKSYENCYPFIYYLEHGKVYYEQAKVAPLIIQPILFFYGFVHLIKACILTVDPNYPETTSVLAHGVSTRKRKKQQYLFFQDEVKIQKTGLFPFITEKMFHVKHFEGEKATMSDLFKQIPELTGLFSQLEGKKTFIEVIQNNDEFLIPVSVLDFFHMTENRFIEFFIQKSKGAFEFHKVIHNSEIVFKKENRKKFDSSPLRFNLDSGTHSLPLNRGNEFEFNELLIHYLLLYNLSMIARYETEWWSELVKTMPNKDFPFIQTFLKLSLSKGPFLIHQFLMNQR